MDKRIWIQLIIVLLIFSMLFLNKKVRLIQLFLCQLSVYKNARTGKISIWDVLCFVIFPIAISLLAVYGLQFEIESELAKHLSSVFSAIFTILLGFAAVIVGKSGDENAGDQMRRVMSEAFVSIVTATSLSLFATISSILLIEIPSGVISSILSMVLLTLSISTIMLLLMITKRIFVIYCDGEQ